MCARLAVGRNASLVRYSDMEQHFFQARCGSEETIWPRFNIFDFAPQDFIILNYETDYPDEVAKRLPGHVTKVVQDPFLNISQSKMCPDCGGFSCEDYYLDD